MTHIVTSGLSFILPHTPPAQIAQPPAIIEHVRQAPESHIAHGLRPADSSVTNTIFPRTSPISGSSLIAALNRNSARQPLSKLAPFNKLTQTSEKPTQYQAKPLTSIPIEHPTYLSIGHPRSENGNSGKGSDNRASSTRGNTEQRRPLYITGFGLFKTHVSEVPDIAALISNARSGTLPDAPTRTLSTSFLWPNGATEVPYNLLNRDNQMLVADGFLMPTKNNGGVYILDKESGDKTALLAPKKGWFYHKAEFVDMNGNELPDLLTARTKAFLLGKAKGELVVATAPPDLRSTPIEKNTPWSEQVIAEGPDFFFNRYDIDGDGEEEIIAPEFSNEALAVYKKSADTGKWQRSVIADGVGPLFDMRVVDLNGDGKDEIVFTNHVNDQRAGLFVLTRAESGSPLSKEGWQQITLFDGIETRKKGPGQASPGSVAPFQPNPSKPNQKPHLLLSGDGSGSAYILQPNSENPTDWSYKISTIVDEKDCMLGLPLAEDLDGDGKIELFVPIYEANRIDVFSYEPNDLP